MPQYTLPLDALRRVVEKYGGIVLQLTAVDVPHTILNGVAHTDTVLQAVSVGALIVGNNTPAWDKLVASIPGANLRNVLGLDAGDTVPVWKALLDAVAPAAITIGAAGAAGTSLLASHRDHAHPSPATWTATAHNLLSAIHGDTTAAAAVLGDIIVATAGPLWTQYAISVPGANLRNVLGVDAGDSVPLWKALLDAVNPADISGTAASPGTSLIVSHRDHVHLHPVIAAGDLHTEYIGHADVTPGEGFVRKTGVGAYTAHKSNLASAANPGVNDDLAAGYSVGSVWINTTLDKVWQCVDSTNGNAVWKDLGGSAHAPVTLDTEADTLLGLTGQELTLDDQIAHKVLIGPRGDLAAKFVAADSCYLYHVDDATLSVGDIYWDMVVWVKVDVPADNAFIVSKWAAAGVQEYFLQTTVSQFSFAARNFADAATSYAQATTFGDIDADTWYMVHVYHDPTANEIGISVNAGVHDTAAIAGGIRDAAAEFLVGSFYYLAWMTGAVGPLAIWKPTGTNLTAAQLTWLYNEGRGRDFVELGVVGDDGQYLIEDVGVNHPLQTWWQMDEVSGTRYSWANAAPCDLTQTGGVIYAEAGPSISPGVSAFRVMVPTDIPAEIAVNVITEKTPGAGVEVDGSQIKDGFFYPDIGAWPSTRVGRLASSYFYFTYDANNYIMYYVSQAKWYFVVGGALHFYVGATEISAYSKPIQSVTDPTNAQDAATQNYVEVKAGKIRSMYPQPVAVLVAAGTSQALPANNTVADVGVIMVPKPITVAKVLYYVWGGGGATSAVRIALYSEDGQTKYWDGPVDVVGAGTGVRTITLATPVTLKPGNYIILICHSVYATSAKTVERYSESVTYTGHIANEPDMVGQVVIVGGAAPATINPLAFAAVISYKIPFVRFLGSAV